MVPGGIYTGKDTYLPTGVHLSHPRVSLLTHRVHLSHPWVYTRHVSHGCIPGMSPTGVPQGGPYLPVYLRVDHTHRCTSGCAVPTGVPLGVCSTYGCTSRGVYTYRCTSQGVYTHRCTSQECYSRVGRFIPGLRGLSRFKPVLP